MASPSQSYQQYNASASERSEPIDPDRSLARFHVVAARSSGMEDYHQPEALQPLPIYRGREGQPDSNASQNRDVVVTSIPTMLIKQSTPVQEEKPKRIACTECRQSKLRCEGASVHGTQPCTRCRRLSLECDVDVHYKRINKRIKLNELAEQVEQLRSAAAAAAAIAARRESPVNALANAATNLANPDPAVTYNFSSSRERQPGLYQNRSCPSAYRIQEPGESSTTASSFASQGPHLPQSEGANFYINSLPRPDSGIQYPTSSSGKSWCLENVVLTVQQSRDLFLTFFQCYHHFLEILDPSLSPDQCYDQSPVLFWSIISVAARRYEKDVALLGSLAPCVTRLLWSSISVLPHSRHTIQGILLMATWTFPTSSMSTDISFMLVSIARSAAMQLGLHRPDAVQDFMRIKAQFNQQEFQNAVRIWAGCYIAAESVTSAIGQPSAFSGDWALKRACDIGNKYTLPDNLRHNVMIHIFLERVSRVMVENDQTLTGYPSDHESSVLMAMLERDFLDLERQISHKLSGSSHILLSMAALQLRTFYLFMSPSSEVRRQGLLRAYATAMTLVDEATTADSKWTFTKYAPSRYVQMIAMAAMLLMKILNSSYSSYVDFEKGKHAFNTALALLRKASVEDNDVWGRASKIMGQLWNLHHSLVLKREQEPSLRIKTRWGASLLHDLLWMWREEFGAQRGTTANSKAAGMTSTLSTPSPNLGQVNNSILLSADGHDGDDGWSTETISSRARDTTLPNAAPSVENESGVLGSLQDAQWMYDMGLNSLLPFDVDFPYDMAPTF